jgi:predicted Zn-dependent protease
MRFSVKFPADWVVANGGQEVAAQPKTDTPVAMVLQLVDGQGSPAESARAGMTKSGFKEVEGGDHPINGLPAYLGTFQGQMNETPVGVRVGFIKNAQEPNKFYLLAGIAATDQFAGAKSTFDNSIGSFHAISQAEADRIQPNRVKFYTVKAGDTWESIAKSQSNGKVPASTIAIMNGSAPESAPHAGDRVRIVAGG